MSHAQTGPAVGGEAPFMEVAVFTGSSLDCGITIVGNVPGFRMGALDVGTLILMSVPVAGRVLMFISLPVI